MAFIVEDIMENTIDTVTILLDQDMEGTWISTVMTVVEEEDIMEDMEVQHTEMAVFTIG